jgi:hypothetical protein
MTQQDEIVQTIKVLRQEIEILTSRLRTGGTGYLHTAIDVINGRIDELIGSAIDGQPDQVRGLAGKIFIGDTDEDVYDGYKEHTEAMEQAQLRKIQDSAAGKPNAVRDAYLHSSRVKDEVEHTKEYYDKNRNRPMEGEDLPFAEGLSNRSMKQKYGHAVMTVSEMMQEELEPLPINTFE